MSELLIRDATLEDAPRLLEIYRYYVEETAISFEWETPSLEEFQGRMRRVMERFPYLVAVADGEICGYCYVHPFAQRAAYAWSVETTIYLDPGIRHRGVGKRLYLVLEDVLRHMGVLNMNACIGYPHGEDDEHLTRNSAEFHAHMGYRMVGTFTDSGYKFGRWYDMVWMEKLIGDHAADPAPVIAYRDLTADMRQRILSGEE